MSDMGLSSVSAAGTRNTRGVCLLIGLLALGGCSNGTGEDASKPSASPASASAATHPRKPSSTEGATASAPALTNESLTKGIWIPGTLYTKTNVPLVSANTGYSLALQKDDTALTIGLPTEPWSGACKGTLSAPGGVDGKIADLTAGKQLTLRLNCFGTEVNDNNQLPQKKYSGSIAALTSDGRVGAPGEIIIVITWKDGSKDYLTA
jgi:hypothetical protein